MATHEERHPEYVPGCAECFAEAKEGAFGWLLEQLPGAELREMPAAGPGHAVAEVFYGETRMFAVVYREDGGLVIPGTAARAIEELIARHEEALDAACSVSGAHSALAGAARRDLERVQGWRAIEK